ncbi:hypothetical protein NDU88_003072 [Pleurodeles waltl]|uniref:Uncharacterized protein n=1 Tax=Pleurodeles waltl TaxID=8319 RepID=A0AAV7REL3_PLEWA|nr:hypothetical protein NDU88_003072 [Pleurodeles waltl]
MCQLSPGSRAHFSAPEDKINQHLLHNKRGEMTAELAALTSASSSMQAPGRWIKKGSTRALETLLIIDPDGASKDGRQCFPCHYTFQLQEQPLIPSDDPKRPNAGGFLQFYGMEASLYTRLRCTVPTQEGQMFREAGRESQKLESSSAPDLLFLVSDGRLSTGEAGRDRVPVSPIT